MTARKKRTCLWLILLLVAPGLAADNAAAPPYMGQEPPGLVPKVFAPGVVCLPDRGEGNICFTKDWRECYNIYWVSVEAFLPDSNAPVAAKASKEDPR